MPLGTFGQTVSSGIQDISAILPLLGTDQCERHVGSALQGGGNGGYLYAAITPLSIFGSLGTAKAAFTILTVSIPSHGVRIFRHMGFDASGEVLSMLGLEPDARQPSRNYNSCPHLEPIRFTSLLCAPYTSTLYISICESTVVQRVIRGLKRFHGEKDRSQSPGPSYSPSSHSSDPASFPATQPFAPPTESMQLATKDYSDVEHS
ncbi:hypothetical protein B0H14DRAFT_3424744 [Mycena olivaceomarginata]|nr:hypothetical protein B0H14DRAFT_3424744 [Mycena olivaceomarginata]